MGIACRVLEAAPATRGKAGETLPSHIRPILHQLGLEGLLVQGGHLPCYGNVAFWGRAEAATHDFIADVHGHGWHLDRLVFEEQLRDAAIAAGVDWQLGTRVQACERRAAGWVVAVAAGDGKLVEMEASFLVDATGRAARIARWSGAQRISLDKLTGYFALVEGVDLDGLPQQTFVESVADGWWYAAAVPGGRMALSFMSDSDLQADHVGGDFLVSKFAAAQVLGPMLAPRLPGGSLQRFDVRPASTGCLDRLSGPGWLAVGDAAFSYDPLSSYGIASAMGGGLYAAMAVRDVLRGRTEAMDAYAQVQGRAFSNCLALMTTHYQQERRWVGQPFWERRS
jgi:flavin-dependent dehydrogenase